MTLAFKRWRLTFAILIEDEETEFEEADSRWGFCSFAITEPEPLPWPLPKAKWNEFSSGFNGRYYLTLNGERLDNARVVLLSCQPEGEDDPPVPIERKGRKGTRAASAA